MLTFVLIKAVVDYSKPHAGYAKPFLGIGSPIVIALLMIILGLVWMVIQRITMPEFFKVNKPEVVDPAVVAHAPAGGADMSSGVVVGYDGSDCAKAALGAAVEVARAYGDKLTVAFGYELSPVGGELHDYHAALNDLGRARVDGGARAGRRSRRRRRRRSRRSWSRSPRPKRSSTSPMSATPA